MADDVIKRTVQLDKGSVKPLYVQIMDIFEARISSGELKPGDRIPPESALVDEFGVSIITVRKAVGELCKKGLLDKKQGRGTFVKNVRFVRDTSSLMSFTDSCRSQGMVPGGKMLSNRRISLDEWTAAALGVKTGDPGVMIYRLRTADGIPVIIERSYFSSSYGFLLAERFDDNSLFGYLRENCGITISRSDKEIELCYAETEEARLLNVPKGTPLILVRSVAFGADGTPVYVGHQLMNGERFTLKIRQGN